MNGKPVAKMGVLSYNQRIFRTLRHRNFRLFWFGQMFSQTGTWMMLVAQSWLVYRLTDSPLMLGLVNFIALVPVVPISLLGGALSDRFPRRSLILFTESLMMGQAFCMALLIWLGQVQVLHVILLSFVFGAASALEQPARLAFVVDVVGKEDLTNAVALNASIVNVARIVGPAAAGLLVAWFGEGWIFFISSISYLVVILVLVPIRPARHLTPRLGLKTTASLINGFRYIWDTKVIRGLLVLVAVFSFFTLPYIGLMPVFARDVLKAGSQGLGFLMAGIGIGAILGALVVAQMPPGRRGLWMTLGNLFAPFFLVLFATTRSLYLGLILVVLIGASTAVRQTLANSLIQITASEGYHGRVMSVFYLLFNGMSQAGTLGLGALASITGASFAVGAGAIVSLAMGFVWVWRMPYLHKLV